jgi:hypothetical protein
MLVGGVMSRFGTPLIDRSSRRIFAKLAVARVRLFHFGPTHEGWQFDIFQTCDRGNQVGSRSLITCKYERKTIMIRNHADNDPESRSSTLVLVLRLK